MHYVCYNITMINKKNGNTKADQSKLLPFTMHIDKYIYIYLSIIFNYIIPKSKSQDLTIKKFYDTIIVYL